jgi:predicted dehydrogenase
VRLGVVGGGKFGLMHLRAFKQLEKEGKAKLVGLADLNEKILTERKKEFGINVYKDVKEMLKNEKIDGISIATPDPFHKDVALTAMDAGKHVLVEKPLDVTVEGCDEMINKSQEKNVLLEVDFHKRFDPYHQELERLVGEGKLGRIEYGYAFMEDRIEVPRDWFPGWAPKSSPAWFLGVHMYDLVRWVIKSDPVKVYATGIKIKLKSLGIDTYDSIQAKIEFKNGSSFTVDTSWVLPDNFEAVVNQGIRVVGSEGIMEVDSQDRGASSCFTTEKMSTYNLGFFKEGKDKKGETVYSGYGIDSITDFAENVNHILEGGSLKNLDGKYANGNDGKEITKIAVGVHRSIEKGEVIRL